MQGTTHGTTHGSDPEAIEVLSRDRLDGYRVKDTANTDRELVGRYLQNLAVSEALYPLLHTLEVVLRNRLHEAVSRAYPIDPDRPDTYHDFPCWIDTSPSLVLPHHQRAVAEAKQGVMKDLRKRFGPTQAQARRFRTPGRLVAKLSFSFWVFLFDADYAGVGRASGVLWPRFFESVFPKHGGKAHVTLVRKWLRRMLVVRNRIMHHERITPYTDEAGALEPARIHGDILQMLDWMAPRASDALREYGPHQDVHAKEHARYMRWVAWRV